MIYHWESLAADKWALFAQGQTYRNELGLLIPVIAPIMIHKVSLLLPDQDITYVLSGELVESEPSFASLRAAKQAALNIINAAGHSIE